MVILSHLFIVFQIICVNQHIVSFYRFRFVWTRFDRRIWNLLVFVGREFCIFWKTIDSLGDTCLRFSHISNVENKTCFVWCFKSVYKIDKKWSISINYSSLSIKEKNMKTKRSLSIRSNLNIYLIEVGTALVAIFQIWFHLCSRLICRRYRLCVDREGKRTSKCHLFG